MEDIFKNNKYTLIERQFDFLADTINHYSENPEKKRCFNKVQGSCRYHPVNSKTDGCAIGRHMTRENQIKADMEFKNVEILIIIKPELFPKWMRELGHDFLGKVQRLHDFGSNWNKSELSVKGEVEFERLTQQILKGKF